MKEKPELQLKESGERMNTVLKEGKTNKELSQKYKCPSNLIAVRRYQFRKRGII